MKRALVVLFVFFLFLPELSMAKEKFNPARLADRIIVGDISEKKFRSLKLTDQQIVEVFVEIKKERGWEVDDVTLSEGVLDYFHPLEKSETAKSLDRTASKSDGDCNQTVEMKEGDKNSAYPTGTAMPRGDECGGDSDDIVMVYNTSKWKQKQSPDKVKWWSNTWWVRVAMSIAYSGNLAGKDLCSDSVRLCIGTKGQWILFSPREDWRYLYLWYKK